MHNAWALAVGEPDFVVMVTRDLDVRAIRTRMEKLPYGGVLRVKPVRDVAGPTFAGSERFRHTYAKLHVFNLTEYARVVFIDADAIVLRDVAALFLLDRARSCAAAPDHGNRLQREPAVKFNTGVLSVAPSTRIFEALLLKLKTFTLVGGHGAAGSDQGFLQAYFLENRKGFLSLPHAYNVLKRREKKLGKAFRIQDVFVLHLVSRKPWEPQDPGAGEYPLSHGEWQAIRRECGLPDGGF